MKRYFLQTILGQLILSFIVIGCNAQEKENKKKDLLVTKAKYTSFYGNFQKGDFLHFYYIDSIDNPETEKVLFAKASAYKKVFINSNFEQRTFNDGTTPITYLFFPGDSIHISITSISHFLLTSKETHRNRELSFCKESIMAFGPLSPFYIERDSSYTYNILNIEKKYAKRMKYLEQEFNKGRITLPFKQAYAKILFYRKLIDRMYPAYYNVSIGNQLKTDVIEMSSAFDCDSLMTLAEYRLAAWNYLKLLSKLHYEIVNPKNLLAIATKSFKGVTKEYLLAKIVKEYDINNNPTGFDVEVNTQDFKYSYYSDYIKQNRLRKKAVSNSGIINMKGQSASLEKILFSKNTSLTYVDFWASWCIPCREEMKVYPELLNALKAKKVRFLFISMDKDVSAWLKASETYPFINQNNSFLLMNNFDDGISKKYLIESIPRYMLIDKNGQIVSANAPRPSDPKLKKLIESNL